MQTGRALEVLLKIRKALVHVDGFQQAHLKAVDGNWVIHIALDEMKFRKAKAESEPVVRSAADGVSYAFESVRVRGGREVL